MARPSRSTTAVQGASVHASPYSLAEVPRAVVTNDDYTYVFEEDPLAASGEVAPGLRIAVRPVGQRSLLIRPRTQFIQELFQSAEDLS